MDSKTLWTVVIVAIVASLITAFVTVKLTGNIIYTPNYVAQNQTAIYTKAEIDSKFTNVKANSCDGDNQCEAKNIVGSNIRIPSSGSVGPELNLTANTINMKVSEVRFANPITPNVVGKIYISTAGSFYFNPGENSNWQMTFFNGNVSITNLDGGYLAPPSRAFVCATELGTLVRSSKPCV